MDNIIQHYIAARKDFLAAVAEAQARGEDTSNLVYNSEAAHIRDFLDAPWSDEERQAFEDWRRA